MKKSAIILSAIAGAVLTASVALAAVPGPIVVKSTETQHSAFPSGGFIWPGSVILMQGVPGSNANDEWSYVYTVGPDIDNFGLPVRDFKVGTGIEEWNHYRAVFGPAGFVWEILDTTGGGWDCFHTNAPYAGLYGHGAPAGYIVTPNGGCENVMHWEWDGVRTGRKANPQHTYWGGVSMNMPPRDATFGFTVSAPPHNVSWAAQCGFLTPTLYDQEDWSKPVDDGDGPVHGPCCHESPFFMPVLEITMTPINLDFRKYMFGFDPGRGFPIIGPIIGDPIWELYDAVTGDVLPGSAAFFSDPYAAEPTIYANLLVPGKVYGIGMMHMTSLGGTLSEEEMYDEVVYATFIANPANSEDGFDFGDAPDTGAGTGSGNYETFQADNGAYHYIIPGAPYFDDGSQFDFPDPEPDGQPTPAADGDDTNDGNDDEDGIVFSAPLFAGQPGSVTITVDDGAGGLGAGQAWVDAWIDLNGNGDWWDAGEQIYSGWLPQGANNISFNTQIHQHL